MKFERVRQDAFLLVLDRGDAMPAVLLEFAAAQEIRGAHVTALGACERATIAYWNASTKKYEKIEVGEQVEIVSLIGNIARGEDGKPRIHAHVALGKRDGTLIGGHLVEAHIYPTLEIVLETFDVAIERKTHAETGLALIALSTPQNAGHRRA